MAAKDTDEQKTETDDNEHTLDMSQAAVKKMIADARERGYITYDQLNQVLPPEQVSSEQIEDVMSMLSEMGINVIEEDEAEDSGNAGAVVETSTSREVTVATSTGEALDRTDDPVRMYLREMGTVELLSPRGRDRHRQADRGRSQHDDPRALRKPADLPGHHHLARRTSERRHPPARRDRP